MNTKTDQIEQFKEMIQQEWTSAAAVQAWTKWYSKQASQNQASADLLLEFAQPVPGNQVLDIAGGPGEPAISVARRVGPTGHVTVTDLSAGLLAANEQNARAAGLTNVSHQQADAHALKFPDQRFDLVTCRFGVMFFADGIAALKEIYRVLKPGGRAAFIAWGRMDHNPYFGTGLAPFFKRVSVPPPPPGAPTPFKYEHAGSLSTDLKEAGFRDVREETRTVTMSWPGTPEELWEHFYDAALAFRPVFDGLSSDERQQAVSEVITGFRTFYDGQKVNIPAELIAAVGTR